jgi:amidase
MTLAEYADHDGLGLAELVKRGEVSANQLAACALEAIHKVNPQLNAVSEVYEQRARKADTLFNAKAPFAGVPFLMKDIGAGEAGKKQEMGSRLALAYKTTVTAVLTKYFKDAGLILLGRTTAPEFALSLSTESVAFGKTRNPWNLERLAGGSSGGAGAIVASGAVPIAHASDGAGSIRIPASACGLVGLKPSRGRVSSAPYSESLMSMNTEFVLCRSLRDAAAMLDAVAKPSTGDPFIIVQPKRPFLQTLELPPEKLRIAFCKSSWATDPSDQVDAEVVDCIQKTARLLADLGHEVEEAAPAFDYQEYLTHLCIAWAYGFAQWLDELASKTGRNISTETLEPVTFSLYEASQQVTIKDLLSMDDAFNQLRNTFGQFFERYDLLLTPTLTQQPEPLGKYSLSAKDIDFRGFFRRCDETAPHLPLANLTGQPAISLPLWQSSSNLPIGMHFMARFGQEGLLLSLGKTLEEALPWQTRKPGGHISNSCV